MYWEKPGPENTGATIQLALERAGELGVSHIVVASNSGETALKLLAAAKGGFKIVCVTHHVGFRAPGEDEMPSEMRERLRKAGVEVLTTTHVLAGVDRGLRNKFGGIYPAEIIASSLRMLGQGVKVCVEISIMALDAGLIPYGVPVVAIGGTDRGADTAVVIKPAHARDVFDTRVLEIIAKPRNF